MDDEIISVAVDAASGSGNSPGFGGFLLVMLAVISLPIFLITKCVGEAPEAKLIRVISSPITDKNPDESFSHFMGRKTKDTIIDFGKGVIGK
jgi:hypothetical protein